MPLTPGTRLGPYEITASLGAGGMGEVFKARDPRLDRSVAIKILPPGSNDDPDRRQRFDREARATRRSGSIARELRRECSVRPGSTRTRGSHRTASAPSCTCATGSAAPGTSGSTTWCARHYHEADQRRVVRDRRPVVSRRKDDRLRVGPERTARRLRARRRRRRDPAPGLRLTWSGQPLRLVARGTASRVGGGAVQGRSHRRVGRRHGHRASDGIPLRDGFARRSLAGLDLRGDGTP
jgi:hypothetical protein